MTAAASPEAAGAEEALPLSLSGIRYRRGDRTVLQDVGFAARRGEVTALVGPNGAGKSSALRLLVGQARPSAGRVAVYGADPARDRSVLRRVGLVPQNVALMERLTVDENLRLVASLMGVTGRERGRAAARAQEAVGLQERRDDRLAHLSGGLRRLCNIAAGLVHDPEVLILDEPTAGVDAAARSRIAALLARLRDEAGLAILLTTHDLADADRLADRVVVLVGGRLVEEGPHAEVVRRLFGGRSECTVVLRAPDAALAVRLGQAGLRPDAADGRRWTGLVDGGPAGREALAALLAEAGPGIGAFNLREPGLDAIVAQAGALAGAQAGGPEGPA